MGVRPLAPSCSLRHRRVAVHRPRCCQTSRGRNHLFRLTRHLTRRVRGCRGCAPVTIVAATLTRLTWEHVRAFRAQRGQLRGERAGVRRPRAPTTCRVNGPRWGCADAFAGLIDQLDPDRCSGSALARRAARPRVEPQPDPSRTQSNPAEPSRTHCRTWKAPSIACGGIRLSAETARYPRASPPTGGLSEKWLRIRGLRAGHGLLAGWPDPRRPGSFGGHSLLVAGGDAVKRLDQDYLRALK